MPKSQYAELRAIVTKCCADVDETAAAVEIALDLARALQRKVALHRRDTLTRFKELVKRLRDLEELELQRR